LSEELLKAKPYKCRKCGGTEFQIYGGKSPCRRCPKCTKEVANTRYQRNKAKRCAASQRYYRKNKEMVYARTNQYRRDNPQKRRAWLRKWQLKTRYNLTLEDYETMVTDQGGVCAICGQPESRKGHPLVVDHCHKTNAIRGLLCSQCNRGIGCLRDDPSLLTKAAEYLSNRKDNT